MKSLRKVCALTACVVFVVGCAQKQKNLKTSLPPVNGKVLIANVQINMNDICPMCLRPVASCVIEPYAAEGFATAVDTAFEVKRFDIIHGKLENQGTNFKETIDHYLELARRMNAKYMVLPVLNCWENRRGNAYSASQPARVGFHLHIYDPQTGKEIWGGNFTEQQVSLTENILDLADFAKRGGKWVPAEKLAQEGVEKLIQQFLEAKDNAPNPGH